MGKRGEIIKVLVRIEAQIGKILCHLDQTDQSESKPPEKEWWSLEELAEVLQRKPFTVREWCRQGRIEANKDKKRRRWRVSNEEAQRLIAGGKPRKLNQEPKITNE